MSEADERFICIHGHFYQPPRENPWLEAIEVQDSAHPFHDWNERIDAECYAPNAAARILDARGRIRSLSNNYARISYDFGPTLLAWLEAEDPQTYRAVLAADEESAERFGGHGSAMAQAYNHMILPLANERDRRTQIRWGIADFRHRFGRDPEGMWLPETAADQATLQDLAEEGIAFTVLAPHQAAQWRGPSHDDWQDASNAGIDPRQPYRVELDGGAALDVFFYDGPISRAVAFERVLETGEQLAHRMTDAFVQGPGPQLVHIATDGETFGHHRTHGEMALAYALHYLEEEGIARLCNYGWFRELHPVEAQARIRDGTSWSCAHGIERWRSDCGCATGSGKSWNQAWRAPLRGAMDRLRDALSPPWEQTAAPLLADPWKARDEYIEVILDRSADARERFLSRHRRRELQEEERILVWKLLELQRHAMLMYTSCGWFFDELSRIETVQVIEYAGRALQLCRETLGVDLERSFLEDLSQARSNLPERGSGKEIYEEQVSTTMLDLSKVGAHYAVSSLFRDYDASAGVYCYRVEREDQELREMGKVRFLAGRARVVSEITREAAELSYGVLHLGDQNLNAGVRPFEGEDAYRAMLADAEKSFDRADFAGLVRVLDRHFGGGTWTLSSLFRDEQRQVLAAVLERTLSDVEAQYRRIYRGTLPLMRSLANLGAHQPRILRLAAQYVLNTSLLKALDSETPDPAQIRDLLESALEADVSLDKDELTMALRRALERLAGRLEREPTASEHLATLLETLRLLQLVPFPVDLYGVQRAVWRIREAGRIAPEDLRLLCERVGVLPPGGAPANA